MLLFNTQYTASVGQIQYLYVPLGATIELEQDQEILELIHYEITRNHEVLNSGAGRLSKLEAFVDA